MRDEKRILVVDDDDAIRALVMTVLRRRGFRIDAARNGIDAMEKIATCRYTLVVLDLMMPQMSGYDVLDRLAEVPAATRPLVLVLTAGLEPRSFNTSIVLGTLHKPFDIELLVDTVSGCIAAMSAQPQQKGCPPALEDAGEFRGETN